MRALRAFVLAAAVAAQAVFAVPPDALTRWDLEALLPQPVLPSRPHWVQLYWATWRAAVANLRRGTAANGLAPLYIDEGYNERLYHWDSCFIPLYARYASHVLPSAGSLDNFHLKLHPSGFLSREVRESDGGDVFPPGHPDSANPPLAAWAEWSLFRVTGDAGRLRRVWPSLARRYAWLRAHRRTRDGLYWNTRLGSGMDNAPRSGEAWVDMSAQQALNAESLAAIAGHLGDEAAARRYAAEHAALKALVNERLWDEEHGLYYDARGGRPTRVKTIASFWPLLAGIPSQEQAKRLAAHLDDPATFRRRHPFASLAADHPDYRPYGGYWRGGVWPPTNYMAIKGLERYGFASQARGAAEAHIEAMARLYRETGVIWEYYAADTAAPANNAARQVVGWSGLGPVALLIENVLGIQVDAPRDALTWTLARQDEHGIRRLRFGDNTVSLVAEARASAAAPVRLRIHTDSALTFEVRREGAEVIHRLAAGAHVLELPPSSPRAGSGRPE